jgi:predicted nucleotidyltransferase
MDHGLTEHDLEIMKNILSFYKGKISHADLFGSRATGTYRKNSDIDLVLHGSLSEDEIDRIWTLFHESSLAVPVDVKSYELTDYSPLKEHIDKVGKTLFTKNELD